MTIEEQLRRLAARRVEEAEPVTFDEVVERAISPRPAHRVPWIAAAACLVVGFVVAALLVSTRTTDEDQPQGPTTTAAANVATKTFGAVRMTLTVDTPGASVGDTVRAGLMIQNDGDTPVSYIEPCKSMVRYRFSSESTSPPDFVAKAVENWRSGAFIPSTWVGVVEDPRIIACTDSLDIAELGAHDTYTVDLAWRVRTEDLPTDAPVQTATITASLQTWNGGSVGLPDLLSVDTDVSVHLGAANDAGVTAEEAATIAMEDPRASYYLSLWARSSGRTASISREGGTWVITAATTQGAPPLTVTVDGATGEATSVKSGQADLEWPPAN